MADQNNIDVNINVNSDDADAALNKFVAAIEQLTQRAQAAAGVLPRLEAGTNRVAEANRRAAREQDEHNASLNTSAVRYEAMVLIHELYQGNIKRLTGSLMVMAERVDLVGRMGVSAALGLTAMAAGLAAFVMHIVHLEQMRQTLNGINAALEATGRISSDSKPKVAALINELSRLSGVSREDAEQIVAQFARVPGAAVSSFGEMSHAAVGLSEALGITSDAAAKMVAELFTNPVEGAKKLDQSLGNLTSTQLREIETLQRMGDTAGAAQIAFKALQDRVGKVHQDSLTPFQQAVERMKTAWQEMSGGIKDSAGGIDLGADAVDRLTKKIELFNTYNAVRLRILGVFGLGGPSEAPHVSGPVRGVSGKTVAEEAEADAASRKRLDNILKENAGYKSRTQVLREYQERLVALREVLNSSLTTGEQKKQAREEIEGINEAMQKQPGLLNEIVTQKQRNAEAQRTLNGYLEQQTQSEKLLYDIQQGKYNRYPAQIAELTALAQKGIALEQEVAAQKELQDVMKGLANLDQQSINQSQKAVSQLDTINRKILEVTQNRKEAAVVAFAAAVRTDMINNQVAMNEEKLEKTSVNLSNATQRQIDAIEEQNQQYALTSTQLRDLNEQQKIRTLYDGEIAKLSPTLIDYEAEKTRLLKEQADALAKLSAKQAERVKFEADWANGAKKALNEVKEASANNADIAYKAFKAGFGSISDVFYNFAQTGKFSFKSLGDSFKQTIDRMVADALAAKLFNALFGNYNQTGVIGGVGGSIASFIGGMFRANGGDVSSGQPYIVGEKGPELFIPTNSGSIVPNHQVAGMSGGNNINLTIHAMDSQSVIAALDKVKRQAAQMFNDTNRTYNL